MIILTLTILVLNITYAQSTDSPNNVLFLAEKFKALQEYQLCKPQAPFNDFKYGNQKVKEIQGVYFCDQYSKRSCCSADNFNEIKLKWFRQYQQNVDLSVQCLEMFTQLICYDCDGDVGQGLRQGLCPQLCQKWFYQCYNDFFQMDENTKKLRLCKQNDIFCSQLKFITQTGEQFCQAMGYQVNLNDQFDEWFDDLLVNTTSKQPVCWDTTPSQRVFGPAYDFEKTKLFDDLKSKLKDFKFNTPSYSKYFYIALGFGLIVIIAIVYLLKK